MMIVRLGMLTLVAALVGCGRTPDPVAGPTGNGPAQDPPSRAASDTSAGASPTAPNTSNQEITVVWKCLLLGRGFPVHLVPVRLEAGATRMAASQVGMDLFNKVAADPKCKDLIRQLYQCDSIELVVAAEPADDKFVPSVPVTRRTVFMRIASELEVPAPKQADAVHELYLALALFQSSDRPVPSLKGAVGPLDLAVNDYLLRHNTGWAYSGTASREWKQKVWTAAEWRMAVDDAVRAFGLQNE